MLMSGLDLERLCLAASPVGLMQVKQACKSSEDAVASGKLVLKKSGPKIV